VVEIPRLAWLPILHGLILPFRSRASAMKYESIWLREAHMTGSPLLVHTERQAHALQLLMQKLARRDGGLRDALWQSVDRIGHGSAAPAGHRTDPAAAAVSAVLGHHHGHRVRRGVSRPVDVAQPARDAAGQAFPRSPVLYLCAAKQVGGYWASTACRISRAATS
jgi:hypothetical protein